MTHKCSSHLSLVSELEIVTAIRQQQEAGLRPQLRAPIYAIIRLKIEETLLECWISELTPKKVLMLIVSNSQI